MLEFDSFVAALVMVGVGVLWWMVRVFLSVLVCMRLFLIRILLSLWVLFSF